MKKRIIAIAITLLLLMSAIFILHGCAANETPETIKDESKNDNDGESSAAANNIQTVSLDSSLLGKWVDDEDNLKYFIFFDDGTYSFVRGEYYSNGAYSIYKDIIKVASSYSPSSSSYSSYSSSSSSYYSSSYSSSSSDVPAIKIYEYSISGNKLTIKSEGYDSSSKKHEYKTATFTKVK